MPFSKRSLEGYLDIDNRESPGVSEDFIRQSGKQAIPSAKGRRVEMATLTCSHCQRQVIITNLRERPRNWCRSCDHYVCDSPGCNTGVCVPFNKLLDMMQSAILLGKSVL